jgi:uncharacterized membrane protein YeaQ/YmgE (transglycosylase-associated protein family)
MLEDRVVLSRIPVATAVAAIGSALCNVGVYHASLRYGRMTIGVTETVVASLIGAVVAGVVYALLGRFVRHAVRWFTVVATIAIGTYGLGPIAAAYEPYKEGAELFTLTTVVSTEIMHIVSGAWILTALLMLARVRVSSSRS